MNRKNILRIVIVAVLSVLVCSLAVYRLNRPKLVALTFDDGPSQYTEALLDGLKTRDVTATFFMNGQNGTEGTCGIKNGHEALLTRMWEDGHQLANHTYQHTNLEALSPEQIVSEITGVEDLIFDAVGGRYECFVRVPGGHKEEVIINNVRAPMILWSVDTLDWKYRNADYVCDKILLSAEEGLIILLHDIYETSVEGALRAVDALKAQGYEFVTVSELMRRTGVHLKEGSTYSKAKNSLFFYPAYKAPGATASKNRHSGLYTIECSAPKKLSVYYTTDGTYPKLSDQLYSGAVMVEEGTIFTAVGVDQYGTRTPLTTIVAGENH